jgi:broad specificity phosphatase PhoE
VKRRAILAVAALVVAPPARSDEAAAWAALRVGGVVALMRHGDAPGSGDPPGWRLDDCATQRNLSERGRAEARAAGARLRDAHVAIDRVVSSPWCRCLETARLAALGNVEVEPAFANAYVLADDRDALRARGLAVVRTWRGRGVLLVVAHGENIRALTGENVVPAEIVVVARVADGTLRAIGSIAPR